MKQKLHTIKGNELRNLNIELYCHLNYHLNNYHESKIKILQNMQDLVHVGVIVLIVEPMFPSKKKYISTMGWKHASRHYIIVMSNKLDAP